MLTGINIKYGHMSNFCIIVKVLKYYHNLLHKKDYLPIIGRNNNSN